MAQEKQATKQNNEQQTTNKPSSYSAVIERLNSIMGQYSNLPMDSIYGAFGRAWANMAPIQNSRLKAIGTLPADITKEELGEFLRSPQSSERPLRQVAEGLKWSTYSFYKLQKTYADIPTYRHYSIPEYITADELKSDTFKREYSLIDKLNKAIRPAEIGHQLTGEALVNGKVFYVPRYSIDKSHNKVNYFFLQRLPQNWTILEGLNSCSKYTISFDLNYFLQIGTDYRQFGDLFEPFMDSFNEWVTADTRKAFKGKYVYASRNNESFESEVKAWCQNGRWMYYVSLPIDKVWTFEIDDTTPIVVSPFSGLMQNFSQQSDREAAEFSLILNPIMKLVTGEMPYYESNSAKEDDGYRLSLGGRALFEALFNQLMAQNNTSGTCLYSAPLKNIHAWDYPEFSNATSVSNSYLVYGMNKTGLNALVPVTENPHQGVAEFSAKLEARYPQCIYSTMERMINTIYESLSLKYSWRFHIFGDIYSENEMRANALKELDKGDISAYFILAALNGQSVLDKLTMCDLIDSMGLLDKLKVPQTAYTQSGKSAPKSDTGGAPNKTETDVTETKIEKQTESATE